MEIIYKFLKNLITVIVCGPSSAVVFRTSSAFARVKYGDTHSSKYFGWKIITNKKYP
jgi:hypothetical protein